MKRHLSCDTVVIGGGTTGIAAAIAAARNGANTILLENNGYLGGNATGVSSWMGFHSRDGEQVIGGIALELVNKIRAKGGTTPIYPDPICGSLVVVNPNWLKVVSAQECLNERVKLLLHSRFVSVEKEDCIITGIWAFGGEGLIFIKCKNVIDCTEAGIVAMNAGETMVRGRQADGKTQVSSWLFEIGNIDFDKVFAYFLENPDDLRPFKLDNAKEHVKRVMKQEAFVMGAFGKLVAKARKDGMELPRDNVPGVANLSSGKFMTVVSRVENVDLTDSEEISRAECEGAAQVDIWLKFLRTYVPGFEKCTLAGTFGKIGVRETSHMKGRYVLKADDILSGRVFEDSIAMGAYHLDIHSPDHGGIESRQPPVYTIPYRSLLGLKTDNLLVAGRAFSSTHEAQASTRVIPISMGIGEAAGTAAALSVAAGATARQLDITLLQATLIKQGAIVTTKKKKM